jgi:hypothetical protein
MAALRPRARPQSERRTPHRSRGAAPDQLAVPTGIQPREWRGPHRCGADGVDQDNRRRLAPKGDRDTRRGPRHHVHTELHQWTISERLHHHIIDRRIEQAEPKRAVARCRHDPREPTDTIGYAHVSVTDGAATRIFHHPRHHAVGRALRVETVCEAGPDEHGQRATQESAKPNARQ